jgi:hypothetical protein
MIAMTDRRFLRRKPGSGQAQFSADSARIPQVQRSEEGDGTPVQMANGVRPEPGNANELAARKKETGKSR